MSEIMRELLSVTRRASYKQAITKAGLKEGFEKLPARSGGGAADL